MSFQQNNEVEITNGIITARLYLPDGGNAYYRGVRFDRSGIIALLDCNGHSYYGEWFQHYNPLKDDAVTGPVEAFDPLAYNDVKAGGTFVKIGIGSLIKPDDSAYRFSRNYVMANPGKWKVVKKADGVEYTHLLKDTAYAYEYTKTVSLFKGKPILILSHTLKNTGERTIVTSVFDHNFLVMDNQPTGPGYTVTFPVNVDSIINRRPDYAKLQSNQLIYLKTLDKKFVSFVDLTKGKGTDNYNLRVENHSTGAAVRITADRPIARLAYWSAEKTICPEPYINIKVESGQAFTWTITYEYYTCDITKN